MHKQVCSGLNASEIKVIDPKGRRTLKFLCEDCESRLLQSPNILKADELRAEICAVRDNTGNSNSSAAGSNSQTSSNESMFKEFQERQNRSCNVILFNFPENKNNRGDVQHLVSTIMNVAVQIKNVAIIGKPNKNGYRTLKVSLQNSEEALSVIRKRTLLKGRDVCQS